MAQSGSNRNPRAKDDPTPFELAANRCRLNRDTGWAHIVLQRRRGLKRKLYLAYSVHEKRWARGNDYHVAKVYHPEALDVAMAAVRRLETSARELYLDGSMGVAS